MTDRNTWEWVIESALAAYGAALDLGENHPVCKALYEAQDLAENAFCREDREGYFLWAQEQAAQLGGVDKVPPCDAWYEGKLKKSAYVWIDGS